jgi:hypothetical protein
MTAMAEAMAASMATVVAGKGTPVAGATAG